MNKHHYVPRGADPAYTGPFPDACAVCSSVEAHELHQNVPITAEEVMQLYLAEKAARVAAEAETARYQAHLQASRLDADAARAERDAVNETAAEARSKLWDDLDAIMRITEYNTPPWTRLQTLRDSLGLTRSKPRYD